METDLSKAQMYQKSKSLILYYFVDFSKSLIISYLIVKRG